MFRSPIPVRCCIRFSIILAMTLPVHVGASGENEFDAVSEEGESPAMVRRELAASVNHALAIREDGTLWGWGLNNAGQLGDGSRVQRLWPIRIGTENDWRYISTSITHTLALKSDGTLWAWGDNAKGQLGTGSGEPNLTPTRVGNESDWVQVSAGDKFSFGVRADGSLWGWGNYGGSRLGPEISADQNVPIRIGDENDWAEVAANRYPESVPSVEPAVFAIKMDGSVWHWGRRQAEPAANFAIPRRIEGILPWQGISVFGTAYGVGYEGDLWQVRSGAVLEVDDRLVWKSVSAGRGHQLVLKQDGTLWSMGLNSSGQLGAGSFDEQNFGQRGDDADWAAVEAGMWFSLARKSDDSFWSWGFNMHGPLGLGDTMTRPSPTRIEFLETPDPIDFVEWKEETFGGGGEDDLAGPQAAPGGVANLICFLLGLDPLRPDPERLPKAEWRGESAGENVLTFVYERMKNRLGVDETIESATRLGDWAAVAEEFAIEIADVSPERERITVRIPMAEADRRFVRLHVKLVED